MQCNRTLHIHRVARKHREGERTRSCVEWRHQFACGGSGASGRSGRRSGGRGLGLRLGGESREFGARGAVGGLEADDAREVGARLVHAAERAARHRTSVVHLHEQRVLLARGGLGGGGVGGVGVGGEHIECERAVRLGGGEATCSTAAAIVDRAGEVAHALALQMSRVPACSCACARFEASAADSGSSCMPCV